MVDDNQPESPDFGDQLECEKKRSEDYLTRLRYMQADLENFKKRSEREVRANQKFLH